MARDPKDQSLTGWRRGRAPRRRKPRRFGPVEYMLLALIMLGIAITVTTAIVNP
jgi:hypothetical protein